MAKRQPIQAAGRLMVSGSTRYTTKGASNKKFKKLKTYGTVTAGSFVGGGLGASVGDHIAGKSGAGAGQLVGQLGGAAVGRKVARHQGWQVRTKQRISVRAAQKHGIIKHNGPVGGGHKW